MESKMELADIAIKGAVTATALLLTGFFGLADAADSYKFDFGDGPVALGYTQVKSTTTFSETLGYGFESGTIKSVDRLWDDELKTDFLTTTDAMVFSVLLPQGNYEVKVTFGDGENESETTIWAENRKLMFDRVTTAGAVFSTQSVSLRRMEKTSIDGSVTMSIKDREANYYTWDGKLTFTITGKAPAVAGIEITPKSDVTTLWLCGNSTVVDQMTAPWAGWGQMAAGFFKSSLAVANYAESGLTASGFYSMKRLAKILAEAKAGDYVTVQFAHNDQKSATEVANYETTLTKYVNDIKAKGAIPLFVTSTARQGELDSTTSVGGLPEKMRNLGKTLGVTVLDLNRHSIHLQNALGSNKQQLYMYTASDKTHFCEYGAYELARAMMEEIKEKVPELAKHLRDDHVAFNSDKPDDLDVLTQSKAPITEGGLVEAGDTTGTVSGDSGSTAVSDSTATAPADSFGNESAGKDIEIAIQGEDFISAEGVKESTNTGFEGEGYLNIDNATGSKGYFVLPDSIDIGDTLYVRFANGSTDARKMTVNGVEIEFEPTGGWTTWDTAAVEIKVAAGDTLEFVSLTENGGPNIDWIGFSQALALNPADSTTSILQRPLERYHRLNMGKSRTVNILGKTVHGKRAKGRYFLR